MPDSPPLRATRRRVLAASAASGSVVLGASGCDLAAPSPDPSGTASPTPSGSPAGTPGAEDDPDEELVAQVVADIAGTLGVVTAAGRGRAAVRSSLREVARTHRAHLDELTDAPTRPRRVRVSGDDAAALRRVRTAEQRLQRRLTDAAVDARSGPLAALLASMAAAVAQRLASGVLA